MPGVSGFSESPVRQNYADMTLEVVLYTRAPSDNEAIGIAKTSINNGIRMLNTRRWWWSLGYEDITTVAATAEYDLSSNFKRIRKVELLNASSQRAGLLDYRDPATFDSEYMTSVVVSTNGSPTAATIYNFHEDGKLSLDVAPSSNWVSSFPTIRVRGTRRVNTLSEDDDTLVFAPSSAELYVLWYAKWEAALTMNPEGPRVGPAQSMMREVWSRLVRDDNEAHADAWEE